MGNTVASMFSVGCNCARCHVHHSFTGRKGRIVKRCQFAKMARSARRRPHQNWQRMTSTRGILRPRAAFEHFRLDRADPPEDLAGIVERLWTVAWELPDGQPFQQEVLPFPNVNLAFEEGVLNVHGPTRGRFVTTLTGSGWVAGARFRPAGFFAIARRPMRDVVEHVLSAGDATGISAPPFPAEAKTARTALLDYIRECLREAKLSAGELREIERVNEWVEHTGNERDIRQAADLAELAGVSVRTLHRTLEKYVGLGSKWIVRRARVQQCAELVAQGQSVDWTRTAQTLGYHDQAHLIRDFKLQIGLTPEAYAEQCRQAPSPPAGRR